MKGYYRFAMWFRFAVFGIPLPHAFYQRGSRCPGNLAAGDDFFCQRHIRDFPSAPLPSARSGHNDCDLYVEQILWPLLSDNLSHLVGPSE
jgi:hypothetical protein